MINPVGRFVSRCAAIVFLLFGAGCSLMIDPNYDELSAETITMTPSEQGVRHAHTSVSEQQVRPFEATLCAAHTGHIIHGPLFFEDPIEMSGSNDDQFAWTLADPLYFVYGPLRYAFNIAGLPISAVKSPLWVPIDQANVSDESQD